MGGSEEKAAPGGTPACRTAGDLCADERGQLLRARRAGQHLSFWSHSLPIQKHREPWAELTMAE